MSVPQFNAVTGSGTDKDSVRLAIGRAAERTGVDFTYLLNQAKSESGLNPFAKASTSSAGGLYQFIDQSWLGVLKQHGAEHGYGWASDAIKWNGRGWSVDAGMKKAVYALRSDPDASALMAGEFASDNADGLRAALGREPSSGDLYFAHFLGLHGAKKFLGALDANPDAPAAALFPREASVNRGIFFTKSGGQRSLAQVYNLMAKKVDGPTLDNPGSGTTPGRLNMPIQMASLLSNDVTLTRTELSPLPPGDGVQLVSLPASSAAQAGQDVQMALADHQGMNMLRPSPRYATLAYLMIASDMDTRRS